MRDSLLFAIENINYLLKEKRVGKLLIENGMEWFVRYNQEWKWSEFIFPFFFGAAMPKKKLK